jgi:hypothetical protein
MPPMKRACCLALLLLLAGCVVPQPPAIRSPDAPRPEQVAAARNIQTRVVQVPIDSVLPRAINVLMDNNFVVRSADSKLGFVSFYQQWMDPTLESTAVSEEGSILFTPAAPGSTQIRVMLTGSWHVTAAGSGGSIQGSKGASGQGPEELEYRKVLDMLQRGLVSQ